MVRELDRVRHGSGSSEEISPQITPQQLDFPASAPTANPVFFRTYSRFTATGRETWQDVCTRTLKGLVKLGKLTDAEADVIDRMQRQVKAMPSGRWLWVGGSEWLEQPQNFSGAYNCTSTNVCDWAAFALMMDLAMMGCGTGGILEPDLIGNLPAIKNQLNVTTISEIGKVPIANRQELSTVEIAGNNATIRVGDSRQGWVNSYKILLELSTDDRFNDEVQVSIDLSNVRPAGEPLKGFGGVANPVRLLELYGRCAGILNKAIGRQLNSVECCLLIDEAAVTIVAGNIRRSAGMRQFNSDDTLGATAKDNLWQQDENGNWRIDPERDSLRMANHTRVFHHKPTLEECVAAVQKQYYSGEGAIQWAGEAVARSNADLLTTPELKADFLEIYGQGKAKKWFKNHHPNLNEKEVSHRLSRFGLNPCGEIIGTNFHCNLSEVHLNQLDPDNYQEQKDAFTASGLAVAALLNHKFQEPRYQYSRELDPIVGVSFTGLFDFFVHAFGSEWLQWWAEGRPATAAGIAYKQKEHEYLNTWRKVVEETVWAYCDKHGIKRPNRCTTVQPSGTKSLLTGASPGWHAPKAQRFIRRITFRKDDPVALACIDYGYSVIPSQSDKDEHGNLLDDAYDSRCTEWLIEIPVAVSWADIPGADSIEIAQFSALSQMDFYMGVQQHYVRHNTSATIELREHEVDELGKRIFEAIRDDEGYISAALLARFDDHQTFPRLPFEPIDKATFDEMMVGVMQRRQTAEFHTALSRYDMGSAVEEIGPAGCDSDKCLLPETNPNS
jgi:ribonucleotide reductase, class II